MQGWIKINRAIKHHWIWQDPVKFKWWIDILMSVNYEEKKFAIGFKLFTCNRGESLMSIGEWAKRWKVSKSIVNRFFIMLKDDGMIETKNETVTIRLKVCNYDSYQDLCNASESQTNRKRIANESQTNTTKERKEIKEIKENKAEAWILKVDTQYRDIISMFIDYKKSKNQAYKNEKSFMLMANKLINMSNNNPEVARQIVEQSMVNNWAGLFELKQNNNKSYEQTAGKARKKLY